MTENTVEYGGRVYLDARASDPRRLGWMQGSPPPTDKQVTFEGDRFLDFPQIRWSLSHVRELTSTVGVRHGDGACTSLGAPSEADMFAIDALVFTDMNGRSRRWDEALVDTYADGILVLHRGRLVYERYGGALSAERPHACFSITKSYAGALAASFVHEGVLDDGKAIPHYLPELRDTAWGDATLRQVMDMQTGLAFTEDYANPRTSFWGYARAGGLRPRSANHAEAASLFEYLGTVRKEGAHGREFAYKTVNTEVMGWVMARVTGRSFAHLLHERLWEPLGCGEDGYVVVDSAGMPMVGAGLSASLRDLARFGELMRREGEWNGKQLIEAAVVDDLQRGGDPTKFAKAGYALLPGYSYRSMWWVTHNELDAFEGRGIHGQRLYIAPRAELVVARFASHPVAPSQGNDPITVPQLLALGRMLRG